MVRKTYLLLIIFFSILNIFSQNYYWSAGKKIFINKSTKKSIQFNDGNQFSKMINSSSKELVSLINYKNNVVKVKNNNIRSFLNTGTDNIFKISDVYTTKEGLELIIFNEIICKGNPKNLAKLTHGIKLEVLKKSNNSRFIIKVKDPNVNILSLSNKLYESGYFEYCYPNFISEITFDKVINHNLNRNKILLPYNINSINSNPNDPYFNKQFYLKNTGQLINDGHRGKPGADIKAINAWGITKGNSSIVVAVIDEGVTSNHPDLPNSRQVRLAGSNFSGIGSVNDPSATGNGNHGNACAGIIAAEQNNGQGITGVSPKSKIMPIKIFGNASNNDIANAIEFAYKNGANIISNSWGYNSSNPNLLPAIVDEIKNAIANNTLVVFAAGNTANHVVNNNGYVNFPANNSNIDGLICVGASNRNDDQANYSPTNSLVEIVAPSHNAYPNQISGESFEVWTIDIPGSRGYNPCNVGCSSPRFPRELIPSSGINFEAYTGRMGGTSSSCPQVAGVASLLLSLDSSLSPIELETIIKDSADKVGNYRYINGRSQEMGFGRLNAYKALLLTNNCKDYLTITSNVNSGQTDNKSTKISITATNDIKNGGIANYDAGQKVHLKSGFKVVRGGKFRSYIKGCSTSSRSIQPMLRKESKTEFLLDNTLQEKPIEKGLIIYPNPSKNRFNIKTVDTIKKWEIYNLLNQKVLKGNQKQMNTSSLPSGKYIIHIYLDTGEIVRKSIIKK